MTPTLSTLQKRLIVAVTLSASFLSVLTQFLLLTAFPKIMEEFSINSTQVQWLTTSFMLTIAILIPITAYFINTFKTRTLMMSALILYIIGTIVGLFAPTFPVLIIGRIIQGMGSGIMIPLMQTVIFLLNHRSIRGFAVCLEATVLLVARAIST